MKKVSITLLMCILNLSTIGQVTDAINQCGVDGDAQFIRQYTTLPGYHLLYFTDNSSFWNGYVGISDCYNYIVFSKLVNNASVKDIEIFGNTAYFCGQTASNEAFMGWFDVYDLASGSGASPQIDYSFHSVSGLTSIDNIEVYDDGSGNHIVAGYCTDGSRNYAIRYDVATSTYDMFVLDHKPTDVALTDNYIVYATINVISGNEIILHRITKSALSHYYYTFLTGSVYSVDPLGDVRIVHTHDDCVATLSYKYEGGTYRMALRNYDLSAVTVSANDCFDVMLPYSINPIRDFRYNASLDVYTVLHRYEVSPAIYRDAVTKIDFSSGTPVSAQSEYFDVSDPVFNSLSLSDSSMYTVFGNYYMHRLAFWKYTQTPLGKLHCLKPLLLPIESRIRINTSPVSSSGGDQWSGVMPDPVTYDPIIATIINICR